MKIRIVYFILILSFALSAQERILPIGNSGRQVFDGKLFLFGLNQSEKSLNLMVYSIQSSLKVDSLVLELKGKAGDYLKLYSDTLHGFLNIYIQKTKSRLVKVVRINRNFSVHTTLDDVDLTRLNSISFFEKEILYAGKNVYTIKSTDSDSAGKQFYLNKYTCRSDKENFEYDSQWQFPFERKFIQSAKIIMADKRHVFVFVNIDEGSKKGQWYLKIDGVEGKLMKAQKINNKGDTSAYVLHKVSVDFSNKCHYLFGQKFSGDEYDPITKKFNLTGKRHGVFFLTIIDSTMEVVSKNDFKIPVTDIITQANKQPSGYLTKTTSLKYFPGEGFKLEMDVFKSLKNNSDCFRYSNTSSFNILEKEGALQLQKFVICPDPTIDQFYSDAGPSDLSGCICTDSLTDAFTLMLKPFNNPAKAGVKKDTNGNYLWLLQKNNHKKKSLNLTSLSPEKKVYKLHPLIEIRNSEEPFVEIISEKEAIIGKNLDEAKVLLQIVPW